jgi:hypothetical protein
MDGPLEHLSFDHRKSPLISSMPTEAILTICSLALPALAQRDQVNGTVWSMYIPLLTLCHFPLMFPA